MASSTADLEASAGIIGDQRLQANVLVLFQQLLTAEFVSAVLREAKVRENNRVYTSPVVMWLMVWQRLQAQGTLESAVVELLRGLPSSFWPHPCKRLTEAVEEEGRSCPITQEHTTRRGTVCCCRSWNSAVIISLKS